MLTSTFDLQGVYANLTIALGVAFDSNAFKIYGAVYAVWVLLIWMCVSMRSMLALKEIVWSSGGQGENVENGPRLVPSVKSTESG